MRWSNWTASGRIAAMLASTLLVVSACAPAPPPTAPTEAPAARPTEARQPAATPAPAAPRKGGTLRASGLGGLPKVLHPYPEAQQFTGPWNEAATLMWNNLIDIDFSTLDWVADPRRSLAKELPKVSNDGKTYTYTLRDDIRWSDGKAITSADFLFAWENASKKENNWVGLTSTVDRIESFKTPDPRTVEVTLKEPLARFLGLSISNGIGPVPKHVWEGKPWLDPQANPEILKPAVVSGPYLPKELTAESHTYTRNTNYWGKQPNLDEIVFVNASPQTVFELLKTRQVEWAQNVPPAQWEEAKKTPDVNAVEWSGGIGTYRVAQFNITRPLLADVKVRKALAHAINRDDLVQLEDNLAVPQYGLYPQGNPWGNDNVEKYDFDLNRSRQLLQDAGFKLEGGVLMDKSGQPAKLEIIWPTTSAPRGKMATYLQQQWKQIGIEVVVTGLEFNSFVDRYQRLKDFDVAMQTWSQNSPDPDDAKSQFTTDGTQNATGYSNPRVDEMFEKGAVEQDDTRRKQIYDEIQKIVLDELPQYSMTTLKNITAFDKKVGGVQPLKGNDILTANNLQVVDWFIEQ